jgi:ABC-2 type transport system ATP-binding protein
VTPTATPADGPVADIAVRCTGLVKHYEDVKAVDGLDLEVRRGECFGLLGPNGAGKTTTVELLEGLCRPDAGTVWVLGRRWGGRHDPWLREHVGIQLQQTELADKLTVAETVRLFRSFYRRGRGVDETLSLLGLEAKRGARVHKLSGGQKQRLALACALVSQPELLFLDEPTTGLDPQARHRIWEVVETFRAGGGSVVLTTHYMDEAALLCDQVAIVDQGRIIARGAPDRLVAGLEAEQIVQLHVDGDLDPEALRGLPGVTRLDGNGSGNVRLGVSAVGAALPAILGALEAAGVTLETMVTKQPSLEDVFIQLTGRSLRDE